MDVDQRRLKKIEENRRQMASTLQRTIDYALLTIDFRFFCVYLRESASYGNGKDGRTRKGSPVRGLFFIWRFRRRRGRWPVCPPPAVRW
jgi:hypothetical protein